MGYFLYGKTRGFQEEFGLFQSDILQEAGIGHARMVFDQTVKVIHVMAEFFNQIIDRYILIMIFQIAPDFLK
jgi:hypothetical protein